MLNRLGRVTYWAFILIALFLSAMALRSYFSLCQVQWCFTKIFISSLFLCFIWKENVFNKSRELDVLASPYLLENHSEDTQFSVRKHNEMTVSQTQNRSPTLICIGVRWNHPRAWERTLGVGSGRVGVRQYSTDGLFWNHTNFYLRYRSIWPLYGTGNSDSISPGNDKDTVYGGDGYGYGYFSIVPAKKFFTVKLRFRCQQWIP